MMNEYRQMRDHNAAVRGYIIRLLAMGRDGTLSVRTISNHLQQSGLITEPDIAPYLDYLHELGFIKFTQPHITPYNAYPEGAVCRLSSKGIQFIENCDEPEKLGIDL